MPPFVPLEGYEDLEVSTQIIIRESLSKGFIIEVINRKYNYIKIKDNSGKCHEIIGATISKNSSLLAFWKDEQKGLAKWILKENGYPVPNGITIDLCEDYELTKMIAHIQFPLVVKPESMNFGIHVYCNLQNPIDLQRAINYCQQATNKIIIEEFVDGDDFRLLVIDNKNVFATLRIPPNVTGNSINTIYELIEQKNLGRTTSNINPWTKIQINSEMENYLKKKNKDLNSIPIRGETILLSDVASISKGGDSIDMTDLIHPSFSKVAIEISKLFGSKIIGIDMKVIDSKSEAIETNYCILEVNEAPMIAMHEYPFIGISRKVGSHVLDVLIPKSEDAE